MRQMQLKITDIDEHHWSQVQTLQLIVIFFFIQCIIAILFIYVKQQ